MSSPHTPTTSLRFTPPEVLGLPEVTQVAIHPDRLEVFSRNCWLTFPFASFAKRQESRLSSLFSRLTRKSPLPKLVGVREFCTDRRFVGFYTTPRLKIFTPPDLDER